MKIFKRFLNNIAFVLKLVTIICGGILGMSLLYRTADFISATFPPLVGVLVLVLLIALALSVLITVLEVLSEDMEEGVQDEKMD